MALNLPHIDAGSFGSFKDRLGFSGQPDPEPAYDDEPYEDDLPYDGPDDVQDFGEYAFDEGAAASYSMAQSSRNISAPALVTRDDVRAYTRYTPPSEDGQPSSTVGGRSQDRLHYDLDSMKGDGQRSQGLASLFSPTTQAPAYEPERTSSDVPSSSDYASSWAARSAATQDAISTRSPYAAETASGSRADGRATYSSRPNRDMVGYANPSYRTNSSSSAPAGGSPSSTGKLEALPTGKYSHGVYERAAGDEQARRDSARGSSKPSTHQVRMITVINPATYNDAEGIVRALKGGDVAAVSLRSTPETLRKRILDFCFGAACALDAKVENPAPQLYIVARNGGLTPEEQARLRAQGVM